MAESLQQKISIKSATPNGTLMNMNNDEDFQNSN